MFSEIRYDENGWLADATGHRCRRTRDWLEPAEATALVEQGMRFLVQRCGARPRPERRERFERDVASRLMTRSQAEAAHARSTVPTIVNPELWVGMGSEPIDLLFFEAGPGPRGVSELINDWDETLTCPVKNRLVVSMHGRDLVVRKGILRTAGVLLGELGREVVPVFQ